MAIRARVSDSAGRFLASRVARPSSLSLQQQRQLAAPPARRLLSQQQLRQPLHRQSQSHRQNHHSHHSDDDYCRHLSTTMASSSSSSSSPPSPHNDIAAFHDVLRNSRRILALCGAGLSASSGLPTFRGASGLWRSHECTRLATPRAFGTDPGLVWLFYAYRRHLALKAQPNMAHRALAALARSDRDFLCLTQNVDNLSQRADHPPEKLHCLHGSLFDIKCTTEGCDFIQRGNYDDPFCPALAPAAVDVAPGETLPLLNPYHRIKHIPAEELPHCPRCKTGLQRPGVVWFGETLDEEMIQRTEDWIKDGIIDLMLVIGTSAQVYPAAGYIVKAKARGARIVTINPEAGRDAEKFQIHPGDFAFSEDAAQALPLLLEPLIGKLDPAPKE